MNDKDDTRLRTTYTFVADNMFIESDLYFSFVIREAIKHQGDLSNSEMAGILRFEADKLVKEVD